MASSALEPYTGEKKLLYPDFPPPVFSLRNKQPTPPKPQKNDDVNQCIPNPLQRGQSMRVQYNLKRDRDTLDEIAPIFIFDEGKKYGYADYLPLMDKVFNFILIIHPDGKHTLVITPFNAIEYGSKHYMMSRRLDFMTAELQYPDTFLFSVEFFIKRTNPYHIFFHDYSSLYFIDNTVNLKSVIISKSGLDVYKEYISSVLNHAFNVIFKKEFTCEMVNNFPDTYKNQKEKKFFITDIACKLKPPLSPLSFPIYANTKCEGKYIGETCNAISAASAVPIIKGKKPAASKTAAAAKPAKKPTAAAKKPTAAAKKPTAAAAAAAALKKLTQLPAAPQAFAEAPALEPVRTRSSPRKGGKRTTKHKRTKHKKRNKTYKKK